jgi:ATP-dependent Clp endopeptidase proteolytic subunit ClpP
MMLQKGHTLINMRVNSIGGNVYDGVAIFNAVRNATCDIDMYVDGIAASMASAIVMAGRKIYMSKYARLMTHKPSGGGFGNSDELRQVADEIDNCHATIADMMSERLGVTVAVVNTKYLNGKDNYFMAEPALKAGLIDGVYDGEPVDMPEDSDAGAVYAILQTRFEARLKNAEVLDFEDVPNNGLNNNFNMRQISLVVWAQVCATMGVTDSVDDSGFVAGLKRLSEKAAKVDAIQAKLTTAETKLADLQKETVTKDVTAMLDAAAGGRTPSITAKQRTVFEKQYAEDPAGLKEVLDTMGAFVSINDRIQQVEKNGVFTQEVQAMMAKGWDKLMAEGGMPVLKAASNEAYVAMYKGKYGFEPNQKPGLKTK